VGHGAGQTEQSTNQGVQTRVGIDCVLGVSNEDIVKDGRLVQVAQRGQVVHAVEDGPK